jgi:predicted RNA-binding Zn ribbon-like protein
MVLPTEDRDGFRFRGGHPALDLAATLAGRRKPEPRELLAGPGDLDRWLRSAGLGADASVTPEDVRLAWSLREAIHGVATSLIAGEDAPEARDTLNRIAAGEAAIPVLDAKGVRLSGGPGALLAALARDAILLLGGERAARIRRCEGQDCALLFVDTSRTGDRRWCSMAGCGNRAKVAEHRRRRRDIRHRDVPAGQGAETKAKS